MLSWSCRCTELTFTTSSSGDISFVTEKERDPHEPWTKTAILHDAQVCYFSLMDSGESQIHIYDASCDGYVLVYDGRRISYRDRSFGGGFENQSESSPSSIFLYFQDVLRLQICLERPTYLSVLGNIWFIHSFDCSRNLPCLSGHSFLMSKISQYLSTPSPESVPAMWCCGRKVGASRCHILEDGVFEVLFTANHCADGSV